MQKRKNADVIRLKGRSGRTMNRIEFFIFGAIIFYIIVMLVLYLKSSPISGYEIKMGSLFISKSYTGFALRSEEVVTSDHNGYINFYVREGERISTRDKVYSIDDSGKLFELMNDLQLENKAYSESELKDIKADIINFNKSFDKSYFQSVYDFKYDLEGDAIKLSNDALFSSMEELNSGSLGGLVNLYATGKTGYIVFHTDGYEQYTLEDINEDIFDQETYSKEKKVRIENNQVVGGGDPICKIVTSDDWSLVIPIEDKREEQFSFDDYMKVKFVKTQDVSWAYVTRLDINGKSYAVLTFNNSCVTFCADRFVEVELIINDEKGLKIPNTAIVEKKFLVVDKKYVSRGGENGNWGVLKEVYDETGNVSYQFINVNIYSSVDDNYYIDGPGLEFGDYIRENDSMDGIKITESDSLIGVYNMNKGYADFKQINILYQNDEYSIVSSSTNYGLTVYDRIVLDASNVNTNDFIYYNNYDK